MAIAYDNSASIADWSTSNPVSQSYTCTGSNLILIVGIFTNSTVTAMSATYNGVAMTLLGGAPVVDAAGNKSYFYYLVNPATGSNTLTVTRTNGANMSIVAGSYTGVTPSAPIDASAQDAGNGTTASSFTTSAITVGSSNNWIVGIIRDTDNRVTTNNVMTQRATTTTVFEELWDSNGTVASGSTTSTYSMSPNGRVSGSTFVSLEAINQYTLPLSVVSFTLTGNAISFGWSLVAGVGSFVLTGVNALLTHMPKWAMRNKSSTTWTPRSANSATGTPKSKNSATWTPRNRS